MMLAELLEQWRAAQEPGRVDLGDLRQRIYDREDNIADQVRLAGTQFGLYPEIVAKVLQEVGLGTPQPDEVKQMIDRQFVELMERLRNEQQNP